MSRELKSRSFSRRLLLHGALGAASTATILIMGSDSAVAQVKISQKAVAYQDHPDGAKRCDRCAHFQPPNACKIVQGNISPEGSCRFFVAMTRV